MSDNETGIPVAEETLVQSSADTYSAMRAMLLASRDFCLVMADDVERAVRFRSRRTGGELVARTSPWLEETRVSVWAARPYAQGGEDATTFFDALYNALATRSRPSAPSRRMAWGAIVAMALAVVAVAAVMAWILFAQ